ncbi:DUF4034 domain-containing protein [Actinoplanes sp. L3-i22]|uniref:DUF4034 domain-containing protein n=1 Tax=Actinoplanes sp. L3-i22 TaxID=2836373 RepID=UPI001C78AF76|nr:DUF4034 domain-containing protein [Actinoplanes sp. L3-i22]BCY15393.1 hypothetical protein L3i22_104810 [Actinoplanes sp. L3-i22]
MWPFRRVPTIDPTNGDPRARALIAALTARDRTAVREIFASTTDPDHRTFLMNIVSDTSGVQDWIGQWIADEPAATLPLLIRGCHAVGWAWDARGAAYASQTGSEQFAEFFRRLRIAEDCLDEVTERDPDEILAWTWLITSARGRQLGPEQAAARFQEVVKRAPYHLMAHSQRLQQLCQKWSGSHQEMFAFVREATAAAPAGHPLPALLATAHFEYCMALPSGERSSYIGSWPVRQDLVAAADKSVLNPAFVRVPGWASRANTFAMLFWLNGHYSYANRVFDLIGDQVTESPWEHLSDEPAARFAAARREVRRNGG